MIPTITVSEMAGRIWRPTDNMTEAQLVERIRAWTKEGLLAPVGEKIPGPGGTGGIPTRRSPRRCC